MEIFGGATMTRCRSCSAEVRWALTSAGRFMPLDVEPDPFGNVIIHNGRAMVLGPSDLIAAAIGGRDVPRYRPHWAGCPDAETWRNRRSDSPGRGRVGGRT